MRLSLVTFPVQIFPAIESRARLSFHQIDRDTGQRVREKLYVPGRKDEVSREDVVKGFEYEKGKYVLLEDEDFEEVKIESKKTLDLESFFPVEELDPLYIDKPYYVVPDGALAEEAYAVVRQALERKDTAAIGRVVLSRHERQVAVVPRDGGMMLYTLHPADAVRKQSMYLSDLEETEVDEDQVAVAETLVERKSGHFQPSKFVDRYEKALRAVIDAKLEGRAPPVTEEAGPGKVIDLMDALKKSLAAEKKAGAGGARKKAAAAGGARKRSTKKKAG